MTGRVGVWYVGARGSVATTATVGALALRAGLTAPTGSVTALPDFAGLDLPGFGDLVFGGHDCATTPLGKRAEQLVAAGVIPGELLRPVEAELDAVDAEIRPGVVAPEGNLPQAELATRLAADIAGFRSRHALDRVVVVHVASTEPPAPADPAYASLDALEPALAQRPDVLPASSLYAYSAMSAGCGYVDFTPSPGARLPALDELARRSGVPYAGSDGKTGETLLKSALAPMFAARALRVLSWSCVNLLGGGDGVTLADPEAVQSKHASKAGGLTAMLGHPVPGPLHIDYVADLGDWKTAWDHIRFEGFLGVPMTMQFTWQGCDSTLAAPLVLDLARLVARAHECGEVGALASLGFFFKDPVGTDEHALAAQYDALRAWAHRLRSVR